MLPVHRFCEMTTPIWSDPAANASTIQEARQGLNEATMRRNARPSRGGHANAMSWVYDPYIYSIKVGVLGGYFTILLSLIINHARSRTPTNMLTLCALALVFSILPYRLAAQFAAFPVCVQPLLNRNFPPSCLSLSLVDQNTCLCQDANAFGSTLVKAVNQECGCADLQETAQLTEAYCNQVGVDSGPRLMSLFRIIRRVVVVVGLAKVPV